MKNHSFPGSFPLVPILSCAGVPAVLASLYPLKPAAIPEADLPSILINGIALAEYYALKSFSLSCTVMLLFSATIVLCYRFYTSPRDYRLSTAGIKILYLSLDDGSDPRIAKEITSLTRTGATVDFVGIGYSPGHDPVSAFRTGNLCLVNASRISFRAFLRHLACSASFLVRHRYHSVHVAGEALLLALWPLLWLQRQIVADSSEPLHRRHAVPAIVRMLLRKFLYLPVTALIVPDEKRFRLAPDTVKRKTFILPDFPPCYDGPVNAQPRPFLTILYYGRLGKGRGTEVISGLLDSGKPVHILMAGRITDEATEKLTSHPAVKWMGHRSHREILKIAATESDFLLCLYDRPGGEYTNFSGLYDAIQVEKPVIVNAEALTARFTDCYPAGYVMPSYKVREFDSLYHSLLLFRRQFTPLKKLKEGWIWSKVENKLISAHRL